MVNPSFGATKNIQKQPIRNLRTHSELQSPTSMVKESMPLKHIKAEVPSDLCKLISKVSCCKSQAWDKTCETEETEKT